MREVEKLCRRVAIISQGRILANGLLDDLRQEHGEQDLEELFFQLVG
jgi:sodium transport system ATP-binding protein